MFRKTGRNWCKIFKKSVNLILRREAKEFLYLQMCKVTKVSFARFVGVCLCLCLYLKAVCTALLIPLRPSEARRQRALWQQQDLRALAQHMEARLVVNVPLVGVSLFAEQERSTQWQAARKKLKTQKPGRPDYIMKRKWQRLKIRNRCVFFLWVKMPNRKRRK